jgi:hypothetical protein
VQLWVADLAFEAAYVDQVVSAGWEQRMPQLDRLSVVTQGAVSMAAKPRCGPATPRKEAASITCCSISRNRNALQGLSVWQSGRTRPRPSRCCPFGMLHCFL